MLDRRLVAVFVASLLVVGVGCDRSDEAESDTGGEQTSSGEEPPEEITSDELPDAPERIVTMGPNVTETVFALGAGDRVVGVSKFSDHPRRVEQLPTVGSFRNPNLETILAREPDLVVGTISGGDSDLDEQLAKSGVPYAFVKMGTIEEAMHGMRAVGEWIGASERAEELTDRMGDELDEIEARHRGGQKPRVLMVHGHEPLVVAGPGTLGHQLLTRAGGVNAVDDEGPRYPRLDVEKVLELDPDRIIDTTTWSDEREGDYWSRFDGLTAVGTGGVVYLSDPVVLRAGPRLPEALRRVAEAIHGNDGAGGTDAGSEGAEQ